MSDLVVLCDLCTKRGLNPDVVSEVSEFGTQELTLYSKDGPTKKCGYTGFVGVFYFNDDGELTEFGAYE